MAEFPSEIEFASFLRYAPRGTTDVSKDSKTFAHSIKTDGYVRTVNAIDFTAKRLAEEIGKHAFLRDYFNASVTLIPCPRSTPTQPGTLWPSLRICQAFKAQGLCGSVGTQLMRIKPVPKSAFAAPGQRPEPIDHYESVAVAPVELFTPKAITLVDDVITRGSSLLGFKRRLEEAYPGVPIRCFAVVRTISPGEVASLLDPVRGTISFTGGQLHRSP